MEHDRPGALDCAEVLLDLSSRIADHPLTYRIPPALCGPVRLGVRVLVPLGRRVAEGFVLAVHPCGEGGMRELREILDVPDPAPLFSEALLALARTVAEESLATLLDAVRCLVPDRHGARRAASALRRAHQVAVLGRAPGRPGRRQRAMLAALGTAPGGVPVAELVRAGGRASLRRLVASGAVRLVDAPPAPGGDRGRLDDGRHAADAPPQAEPPTLLWGDAEARGRWVADAIAATVRSGRQALVTVPEIARAPEVVARVGEIAGLRVAALHSDLPPSRRRALWAEIRAGAVDVVVGTRSALWAPLDRLGLLVVDDEHDPSYKPDAAPRCHARAVALARGRIDRARVVLGTQTPSVEAYAAAACGRMRCVRLAPAGPAVRVTVVDMKAERQARRGGVLAQPLIEAIRRHLRAGGRVALFVNRVGYARVLLCRECGFVLRCPRCGVPMPYDRGAGAVRCRVCGHTAPAPDLCPRCRGVALWWVGAGTARVEEVVRRVFPALRTARLDRETAPAFGAVAEAFASGRVPLVVGTQLLLRARRLRPSLVGVVDADAALYLPDFRAAERAFQQLRAVASLAGGPPDPEAVVQTRAPEHPVLAALRTGEDERVYESELRIRREVGYPPYAALACLVASSRDREAAQALAARAAAIARAHGVEVLGPAPAPGGAARFRVQCVLRAPGAEAVRAAAREALARAAPPRGSRLIADLDASEVF